MARFIQNGNLYINVDFVKTVIKTKDNNLRIEMKDGEIFYFPGYLIYDLTGEDAIKKVVPVKNVYAVFKNGDGEDFREPVPVFAVTESGELRPVDLNGAFPKFIDMYSNYRKTDCSEMVTEKGEDRDEEICC